MSTNLLSALLICSINNIIVNTEPMYTLLLMTINFILFKISTVINKEDTYPVNEAMAAPIMPNLGIRKRYSIIATIAPKPIVDVPNTLNFLT